MERNIYRILGVFWGSNYRAKRLRSSFSLVLIFFLFFVSLAYSTTYTVTNTNDSGSGSLRKAISNCMGDDTCTEIVFSSGVSGTISLSSYLLMTDDSQDYPSISITGPGKDTLTISGSDNVTVFYFDALNSEAVDVSVTISGLEISGGNSTYGGGILVYNDESPDIDLTIDDCRITGNTALNAGGGIKYDDSGTLIIKDSIISSNIITDVDESGDDDKVGGGIYCESGTMHIIDSTIKNNSAANSVNESNSEAYGGGIYSECSGSINGTTISNNNAYSTYEEASTSYGGGVYISADDFYIVDSTISANRSFESGAFNDGYGGGIYCEDNESNAYLDIRSSTISGNKAGFAGGGVFSTCYGSINDTTIKGNYITGSYYPTGAGLFINVSASANGTDFIVNESTISNNTSSAGNVIGGGIYCYSGDLTLTKSSISGNSGANGAGMYVEVDCAADLENNTIANNSAANSCGGGCFYDDTFNFYNNTIVNNSASDSVGGLYIDSSSVANFTNNILANNTSGNIYKNCYFTSVPTSSSTNLSNRYTGCVGTDFILAHTFFNLISLADNGGSTNTIALLADSPGIDAGTDVSSVGITEDQRGESRPVGYDYDIGAYEYQGPDGCSGAVCTVTSTSDDFYPAPSGSLREAIRDADDGDIIYFDSSIDGDTISLDDSLRIINKSITIYGSSGSGNMVLSGQDSYPVLFVAAGNKDVQLNNLVFQEGAASNGGALIVSTGDDGLVELIDSFVLSSSANYYGGGIYCHSGYMVIETTAVEGNIGGEGGGIYTRCNTIIRESSVSENDAISSRASGLGGGLMVGDSSSANTIVENSTFAANNAQGYGGGIYLSDSYQTLSLAMNTIAINNAESMGGGIYIALGSLNDFTNNIVAENVAGSYDNCYGTAIVGTTNLTDDYTGCDSSAFTLVSDVGFDTSSLEDNGGPTKTVALGSDSDAIDAGTTITSSSTVTDQRGVDRPQDDAFDIGSYEYFTTTISVNPEGGTGTGTVYGTIVETDEVVIGCSDGATNCSYTTSYYNYEIYLEAVQATGSNFINWTGDCSGTSDTCSVYTTPDNKSITAVFDEPDDDPPPPPIQTPTPTVTPTSTPTPAPVDLTVSVVGTGSGNVQAGNSFCEKLPDSDPVSCTYLLPPGNKTLTATASANSTFLSWSSNTGCSNSTECSFALDDDLLVEAMFEKENTESRALHTTITGQGSLQSIPPGLDCSSSSGVCSTGFFTFGEELKLEFRPDIGYRLGDICVVPHSNPVEICFGPMYVVGTGPDGLQDNYDLVIKFVPLSPFVSLICDDINGDGGGEIVAKNSDGELNYTLDLNKWLGMSGTYSFYTTGQLNGDSRRDVIALNMPGNVKYTTDLASWTKVATEVFTHIAVGDITGDNNDEIVGIASDGEIKYTANLQPFEVIDGFLDTIETANLVGGAGSKHEIFGNGPPGGAIFYTDDLGVSWDSIDGTSLVQMAIGDFDGNGSDDIAGIDFSNNLYYSLDVSNFVDMGGAKLRFVVVGDVNNDSKDDIVGIDLSGNVVYTTNMSTLNVISGALFDYLAICDLNKDGMDDIAGVNGGGKVRYSIDKTSWITIP